MQITVERGDVGRSVARLRQRGHGRFSETVIGDAIEVAVEDVDAVAVGADPDRAVVHLQRTYGGGVRQPVRPARAVTERAERARLRIVSREPLAPRPDPDRAAEVAQQGADAVSADRV